MRQVECYSKSAIRRIGNVLLLLCTVLGTGAAAHAGATAPMTLHYKVQMKSSAGNMGTREVWLKNGKMRCNIDTARLPITLLKNSQGVFLLHSWNKIAGKYPDGSPRGNVRALLPGPTGSPKAFLRFVNGKRIGTEQVGKKSCDVYSYTDPTTKRFCKIWVERKSGQPVKLWLKGALRVASDVTVTYLLFKEGEQISDSIFELPKGYAVRPMPKREVASKALGRQSNSAKTGI